MQITQLLRYGLTDAFEEFTSRCHFRLPFIPLDGESLIQLSRRNFEAAEVEFLWIRNRTHCSCVTPHAMVNSIQHPFQDPQILSIAGPQIIALGVLTEPVDHEDARRMRDP